MIKMNFVACQVATKETGCTTLQYLFRSVDNPTVISKRSKRDVFRSSGLAPIPDILFAKVELSEEAKKVKKTMMRDGGGGGGERKKRGPHSSAYKLSLLLLPSSTHTLSPILSGSVCRSPPPISASSLQVNPPIPWTAASAATEQGFEQWAQAAVTTFACLCSLAADFPLWGGGGLCPCPQ